MNTYSDNDNDTAMTIVASDDVKELLAQGNVDEIQKMVQATNPVLPVQSSCFSWSAGQIVGKYEIVKKIGKGGMGVIYLARHTQLQTLRALKVLPFESVEDHPVFAERFIREARIASQIRHQNVVEVMDVEVDPELNISYIVMEYVDGGSLRQVLKSQGKLTVDQAVITLQGVTSALAAAAEHGIVHRDIKPDNIMFTKQGGIKLADLGIAKKADEDDNLTKTNVMMGTPAYLSPEQVENPKAVDIRSDIYSLGATFYEMLTGQQPYPGKSSFDILRKIFADPVPNPRDLNPEVPEEIARMTMKMLAKEADRRYQTPGELLEELAAILPAISDTSMQSIVKSIINLEGTSGVEGTQYYSVLTGTLNGLHKKRKQKKILLGSILLLLLAAAGTAAGLFIQKTGGDSRKKVIVQQAPAVLEKAVPLRIRTMPGAELKLISENGQVFSYMGDGQGNFKIDGLQPGGYDVVISCADHYTYKKKHQLPEASEIFVSLKPDLKKVLVTAPPQAKLELFYPDGKSRIYTVPDSGQLRIASLKRGNYSIKASCSGYLPAESHWELQSDRTIDLQMESLYKRFHLNTLPGSQVKLLQNSVVKYSGQVNSAGVCSVDKVTKGVYELSISAPDYATHGSFINIEKDTSLTIRLLKKVYSLTVYTQPETTVQLTAPDLLPRTIKIPAAGSWIFSGLNSGRYTLHFSQTGYKSKQQTVTLKDNAAIQVELERNKPLLSKLHPAALFKAKGKVRVYISAAGDMAALIKKHGVLIVAGSGKPVLVREFPFVLPLAAGRVEIAVSGRGLQKMPAQTVRIVSGKETEIVFEPQPIKSQLVVSSNRPGCRFTLSGKAVKAGERVEINTFTAYELRAFDGDDQQKRTIKSGEPGLLLKEHFLFAAKIHPRQREYERGLWLLKDEKYKEALELFQSAASARHFEAAFQAGIIWEKGLGMWLSDSKKALTFYDIAAQGGIVEAAVKVADAIYEEDYEGSPEKMLQFYLVAVKARNPQITYKVSNFYKEGYKTIAADPVKCLQYLKLAAELGVPEAMFDLGIRYEKGDGVSYNSQLALEWIQKAARAGHEKAERYQRSLIR